MEQHAVPQDITGFKFKLVGDMTLKQFGELAGGALVAWLFFSTSWIIFIKLPLALFFGFLGVALAFFPIEERPLDVWIFNFFRAIYRPTYYIWKKNNAFQAVGATLPEATTFLQNKMSPVPNLASIPPSPAPEVQLWPFAPNGDQGAKPEPQSEKKAVLPPVEKVEPTAVVEPLTTTEVAPLSIDQLSAMREQKLKELEKTIGGPEPIGESGENMATPPAPTVQKEELPTTPVTSGLTIEDLVKKRAELTSTKEEKEATQLSQSETQINELIGKNKDYLIQIEEIKNKLATLSGPERLDLEKKLEEIMAAKGQLGSQITTLRGQITQQRVGAISTASYSEGVEERKANQAAKAVNRPIPVAPVLSLTSMPNVINGLVTDQNNSPIDGAILIIKDKTGNSIRALKTNKVGQFMVSTPLENGTYYLELEKAGLSFDTWEVTLKGEILKPIEIKAKAAISEPVK